MIGASMSAAPGNWGRHEVYATACATILFEPITFHLTSWRCCGRSYHTALRNPETRACR